MGCDIEKMAVAARTLLFHDCEKHYIEHINQSCPANVLQLIDRLRAAEGALEKAKAGVAVSAHEFEDAACYND